MIDGHRIVVIGGGPAGMMAAGRAAEKGCEVILLEKMHRLGSKLAITGKGRCNLTNMGGIDSFIEHYGKNGNFLRNCFARFFNQDLIDFFETRGVRTVLERGQRVFPRSGNAEDIVECLAAFLRKNEVEIRMEFTVDAILTDVNRINGVRGSGVDISCDAVIIATGGRSYPMTGSTGDGYRFAMDLGHRVRKPEPALVPIEVEEDFIRKMQGLSLKNVEVSAYARGRRFTTLFGEMLFTHFGVSGPIILTMSRQIVQEIQKHKVTLSINFKPALTDEQLERRLLREFDHHGKMKCRSVMKHLLPVTTIDIFLTRAGIPADRHVSEINREERQRILHYLRDFRLTVKGPRPISEAIITDGGVALDEIDPYTMQSRLVSGLFFCGEVIDVAGDTGGYNLQAAFSTGHLAGESACSMCRASSTRK
ncbi:MAG: NAD(P)/FAD-dependent oxidoreductase [candidate division WOR-3 bacterium]|nr:MAG: NAD(P)/FAD-dependent oxidoreductase [candidate division WOR-3 bacterium]